MLREVLQAIECADTPLNIQQLSAQLDIEEHALYGMLDFWVRKGKLKVEDGEANPTAHACGSASMCRMGAQCSGPSGCPFTLQLPKTYMLNIEGMG